MNPPTLRDTATATLLAAICAGTAVLAACRGDWFWAVLGALGALTLAREAIRDITARRNRRNAR